MIIMKRGDRRPTLTCTLQSPPGTPVSLAGATVRFIMANSSTGVVKFNSPATVVSATQGRVAYEWGATDTDTVGLYKAEWEITFSDATKMTVPTEDYLYIRVVPDLA